MRFPPPGAPAICHVPLRIMSRSYVMEHVREDPLMQSPEAMKALPLGSYRGCQAIFL